MSWGSSKMSNGSTYYGPLEHKEYIDAIQHPEDWLNAEWSEEKQKVFNDLYDFSIGGWSPFRNQFDKILDERNRDLYMDRYDINYADVKDPRKLATTSSVRNMFGGINFVSSNVKRLYKN